MTKEAVTAKLSPNTVERLEEWAEEKDISRSEATNRLLDKALDIEQNEKVVVQTDGGAIIREGFEQIDTQLQEIDREIETVRTQNERVQQIVGSLLLGTIGIVIWAASVLLFDVSLPVSLSTGGVLLLYFTYYLLAFGGYIE